MDEERTRNKTRFFGLSAHQLSILSPNENSTQIRHHQFRKTNTTIQRLLHAQTKSLPQPWGFLLGKTRREQDPRTMAENSMAGKNCEFKNIKQEDLLISRFITSFINLKIREKLLREKTPKLKTTMDLVTHDSYERRHKE